MDVLMKGDFDDFIYGLLVLCFLLICLKELESYMKVKCDEVVKMVNIINKDWEECLDGWNFKWNEVIIFRVF